MELDGIYQLNRAEKKLFFFVELCIRTPIIFRRFQTFFVALCTQKATDEITQLQPLSHFYLIAITIPNWLLFIRYFQLFFSTTHFSVASVHFWPSLCGFSVAVQCWRCFKSRSKMVVVGQSEMDRDFFIDLLGCDWERFTLCIIKKTTEH